MPVMNPCDDSRQAGVRYVAIFAADMERRLYDRRSPHVAMNSSTRRAHSAGSSICKR
jgi:hypothetical protein